MRVLLADDQHDIRSAVRLLLEQEDGVEVVGESADAETCLRQASCVRADVVLLDWELPGEVYAGTKLGAGQRIVLSLRQDCPWMRIVVLSGIPEARNAALSAGVDAFVSKGDPPEQLLAVLAALGKGVPTPTY